MNHSYLLTNISLSIAKTLTQRNLKSTPPIKPPMPSFTKTSCIVHDVALLDERAKLAISSY